jgi:hypothetical protein
MHKDEREKHSADEKGWGWKPVQISAAGRSGRGPGAYVEYVFVPR